MIKFNGKGYFLWKLLRIFSFPVSYPLHTLLFFPLFPSLSCTIPPLFKVTIHTDTLNESCCVERTLEAFKGRCIHTYHTEGAGGENWFCPSTPPITSTPCIVCFFCFLFSVFCFLFSVFCFLFSVFCFLFSVFCFLFSVFFHQRYFLIKLLFFRAHADFKMNEWFFHQKLL